MSIADDLEVLSSAYTPGPECSVKTFLGGLDAKTRAEFEDALGRTRTIKSSVLARHIRATYGAQVSDATVGKHRKGECKCSRTS